VVFSGDLGRSDHPLLDPPATLGDVDWVVVESTYGDRVHEADAGERFADAVRRGIRRGGAIVIPSFAVDRTEVVLHHLARMARAGELDGVRITVDSPMALAALDVYRDALADDRHDIRDGVTPRDFEVPGLREAHTTDASKEIDRYEGPQIVIASSGMATGGRVLHHLVRFLPERTSTVLLVGYQATGTRGRALADGATALKMFGRYVSVRATIETVHGLSVHADQPALLDWLRSATTTPECVFCVHGERDAAHAFAALVAQELDWTAGVPAQGDRVVLERLRRSSAR
jgi:metallo-beta-lactamase family protein